MYQIQLIISKRSIKGTKLRSLSPERFPYCNFFKKY